MSILDLIPYYRKFSAYLDDVKDIASAFSAHQYKKALKESLAILNDLADLLPDDAAIKLAMETGATAYSDSDRLSVAMVASECETKLNALHFAYTAKLESLLTAGTEPKTESLADITAIIAMATQILAILRQLRQFRHGA